jgi:hypothetical protein
MLFQVLLISIILVGLAFAGFAIKMFFNKNAEFKKSCASIDPATGSPYGCSCGNGDGGESCENSRQSAVDSRQSV